MVSDSPLWPRLKVSALVALAALSCTYPNPAQAAEYDCETMAFKLNPGDDYEFKLEIQSKTIRIEKGEDFCSEPAKKWFGRQLILPRPARKETPLAVPKKSTTQLPPAEIDNNPMPGQAQRERPLPDMGLTPDDGGATPLPIQREFVKPKTAEDVAEEITDQPVVEEETKEHVTSDPEAQPAPVEEPQVYGVAAPPPPKKDESLVKRCDRDLVNFWSPGQHVIEGKKYWLSGVFTIDIDSDGRVDDVGFKIKAEGRIGNILNYFPPTEGRLSGKTVDSLKLDDDRDIHRLCPGNVTFERPGAAEALKKKRKASQVKVLGERKPEKVEEEPEEEVVEETKKKDVNPVIFIVGGIALVLLLAGGVGLAFAVRNMTSSKDEEYEYEEEDNDD